MKIYTKTGDKGKTSLLGGDRVSKSHVRVEAYGTVDELNSFIAHLKDKLKIEIFDEATIECLNRVNKDLFDIGSLLAVQPDSYKGKMASFDTKSILMLEEQIDKMDNSLEKLQDFILPGGHPLVSFCHICRTVCRRAERRIVALAEDDWVDDAHITYFNRLSDYLFILARYIAHEYGIVEDKWHE